MDSPIIQKDSPLVLIVDDDKFMRIQLRHAMQQVGYQVVEASDGQEALATYSDTHPDIVLLDAMMPEIDGFTCCNLLRTLPGGDRTPVLMITALEDQESVDQAFEAGAMDYITKPIHWAVLRQRVRRLLEASHAMEKLRQQTERAKLSEERLRIALEASQMQTWNWEILSGEITHSVATEAIHGFTPSSCTSTFESFLDSIHPQDRESVTQSLRRAIEEGADYDIEFRVIGSNHTVCWIASKGQVYYDEQGKAVRMTGINMDITARKQAQDELQRQNWRSQLFAEVTLKIRQSLHLEDILQTTVTEVQQILKADRVLIFQFRSSGVGTVVTEALNPSWISLLNQNVHDEYFESEYLQKYSQGRIYTIADVETARLPDCLIDFMSKFEVKAKLAVPIFLKEKLWGLLVAHQCAHPRQWSSFETELLGQLADQIGIALAQAQLLEQETRQRQELTRSNSELQQFASIASHDLQEPLRKIQAFGTRIKATCGDALTEQGQDYLDRMENAAHRMQTLIDDLLMLSRVTTKAQPFVPVNLAQITREVLSDLEIRIQQTGGCVQVSDLPTLEADPLQMRQLFQNLISNALKFHRNEEPPVVKIYSNVLRIQENHPAGSSSSTELCQIIVEDNGIGFDEKYLDRIFNVFQRLHTRSEYEGTGMGLAICRKIVERHGGTITAKSMPCQGATFIVTLPIHQRTGEKVE